MLNVWAYSAADWWRATRLAAGVNPVVSPPFHHENMADELAQAARSDLVYLNLHGFAGQDNLFGQLDEMIGPTALTPQLVAEYDWHGAVIYAEVCFSAAGGGGVLARAFLQHGAAAFIGSTSEAYGRVRPSLFDGEADRLGWFFRKAYGRIGDARRALIVAKRWLRAISWPLDAEDRATLKSFVLLEEKYEAKNE